MLTMRADTDRSIDWAIYR